MDGPKGEEETRASYDTGHAPRHTQKEEEEKESGYIFYQTDEC